MLNSLFQKNTITADLARWLTGMIVIMVTVIAISYYIYSSRQLERILHESAAQVTDEISGVLALPLHNLDEQSVKYTAKAYLNIPSLLSLRIKTDFGQVLFDNFPEKSEDLLYRQRKVTLGGKEVGSVEMLFTDKAMRTTQRDTLVMTLLIAMGVLMIIITGTQYFMRTRLNVPLARLGDGIRQIAAGNYQNRLVAVPQQDLNEIIDDVNTMADKIARQTEQLVVSEKKYRRIFDNIAEGYILAAMDGTILVLNPAGLRILKYEKFSQLEGENIVQKIYLNPDDREVLKRALLATGSVYDYPVAVKQAGGQAIFVEINSHLVHDTSGAPVAIETTFHDITERKRAEEALRESRQQLLDIAANIPGVIYQFVARADGAMKLVYVSGRSKELFELDSRPDDFFDRFTACVADADRDRFLDSIRQVVAAREPWDFEGQFIKPSGEMMWFNGRSIPQRKDGDLVFNGVLLDITERKRAEMEVQRLKNYLTNIINSMPSVLIGVDTEGVVTQWNAEAERNTSVPPQAAIGRHLAEFAPQFALEMERIKQSIAERATMRDSKVAMKHGGQVRFNDVTIYPLVANCVEGAVIRIDDVTERVRMEEMMIQTEKMMSVGGLAAGMAHEINNPLAGIMQNLQVLEMYLAQDTPKNRRLAEECGLSYDGLQQLFTRREVPAIIASVLSSGKRAAKIVGNMLSFSRKTDKGFTENDVAELLDNTVELAANDYDLKKKYDFRQIEIVREYEPAPKIRCEASQIQQVFLNILRNGAQAMAGYATVDKERKSRFVLRVKPGDNAVRVEIADNGPGMDDATRKRVFEPFFTTKEIGLGTGLGMSVSYFIITENYGGSIDVESKPGEGANFIVTLPVRKGNAGV